MKKLIPVIFACLLMACGSSKKSILSPGNGKATYRHLFYNGYQMLLNEVTFQLDSVSVMPDFGYSVSNPIMTGGGWESGAYNQRRFLNALLGPNGDSITYRRLGSCCPFDSPNGLSGGGLLDKYEIKITGQAEPVILYLNLYDKGVLRAPMGFTYKK